MAQLMFRRPRRLALGAALLAVALAQPAPPPAAPATHSAAPPIAVAPIGDRIYPALGQSGLDVRHYDLHLTVDTPGTRDLRGDVTVTLGATRPLGAVQLDFLGPEVSAVTWNGRAAPFRHDQRAGKLTITPPTPLAVGQEASVRVQYAGTAGEIRDSSLPVPLGWQGVAASAGQAGTNFALSEPDGTRGFVPVNDHPSDPATFRVRVTVPASFRAAASGTPGPETVEGGTRTATFRLDVPIPTYALGLFIGDLQAVDGPAVAAGPGGAPVARRDYFPASVGEATRAPYAQTGEMLRVLSGWFGPYPFASYGSAVVTARVPALETATLSTMPVASSRERVIVHELAHQWFGNRVPLGDWADTWLNEGPATYAELLWAESRGEDPEDTLRGWHFLLQQSRTRPLSAVREEQLFDRSAYLRGALLLHALRREVGDARFRAFLRGYTATFAARPVRTADFLKFVEGELGDAALATARLWAEAPELPPLP